MGFLFSSLWLLRVQKRQTWFSLCYFKKGGSQEGREGVLVFLAEEEGLERKRAGREEFFFYFVTEQ